MSWLGCGVGVGVGSAVIAASLAGCSAEVREPVQVAETVPPRMQPTSAEVLDVVLDSSGRPYDVLATLDWQNGTVGNREIGTLFIPDGHLRVMDGNAIEVDPKFFADEAARVEFGGNESLQLSIVTIRSEYKGSMVELIAGVRIDVDQAGSVGTGVEQWQPFEHAYGTDGGIGGVTAQSVVDDRKGIGREIIYWGDDGDFTLGDHDGIDGADTFLFSNGIGDGGFPMTRGLNAKGELVSLMVWHMSYPWRLAVPDGKPPVDITIQENSLLECMAGTRLVDHWNNCLID